MRPTFAWYFRWLRTKKGLDVEDGWQSCTKNPLRADELLITSNPVKYLNQ